MNNRIKELNLKAMSIVLNGNDPDRDVNRMYIPSYFTEKFAELIIKECADIADCAEPYRSSDLILKKFGLN